MSDMQADRVMAGCTYHVVHFAVPNIVNVTILSLFIMIRFGKISEIFSKMRAEIKRFLA